MVPLIGKCRYIYMDAMGIAYLTKPPFLLSFVFQVISLQTAGQEFEERWWKATKAHVRTYRGGGPVGPGVIG